MAPLAPAYAERIRPELFLSFCGSGQLNESERVKSTLEGLIVKPGGKKPSSTNFLMPITGIITFRMKRKIKLNQGIIHAFTTINISY